jgi:hypothetical protein
VLKILFLAFCQAFAADPKILGLESSKTSYAIGEKALLSAHVKVLPRESRFEVFLEGKIDGVELKLTRLTESEGFSLSAPLAAGQHLWEVKAYFQDRDVARGLEGSAAFLAEKIRDIEEQIAQETDPETIQGLLAEKVRMEGIRASALAELAAHRRLIATAQVSFNASAARSLKSDAAILVESSRSPNDTYLVGETATFFVHVLTGIEGSEGPMEFVAQGQVPGLELLPQVLGERDFSFTSVPLATVGNFQFSATVRMRPKSSSDKLRKAITAADKQVTSFVVKRDNATTPENRAYYQALIDELDAALDDYQAQLERSLSNLEAGALPFTVTNP